MPQPTLSWMAATWPVTRGPFQFNPRTNQLVVLASDGNVYYRASPIEIAEHVMFLSQLKPSAWYQAQLIHYGLQASADLQLAMLRLRILVKYHHGQRPARVPREIMRLEKQPQNRARWLRQRRSIPVGRRYVSTGTQTEEQAPISNTGHGRITSEPSLHLPSTRERLSTWESAAAESQQPHGLAIQKSETEAEAKEVKVKLEPSDGGHVFQGTAAEVKTEQTGRKIKCEFSPEDTERKNKREFSPEDGRARVSMSSASASAVRTEQSECHIKREFSPDSEVRLEDIPLLPWTQQTPTTHQQVDGHPVPQASALDYFSGSYRISSRHPGIDATSTLSIVADGATLWCRVVSTNSYAATRSVIHLRNNACQGSSGNLAVEWRGQLNGRAIGQQQGCFGFLGNGSLKGHLQGIRGYSFKAERIEVGDEEGDGAVLKSIQDEWVSLDTNDVPYPDAR